MTKGVIAMPMSRPVSEAAKAMERAKVGSVIVLRKGKAIGIVTERDIVRKVIAKGRNPRNIKLGVIMSTPLHVIRIDTPIDEAARAMKKYDIKKLPVITEKGMVTGMVTETDIIRAYPGLVDVLIEVAGIGTLRGKEPVVGVCERCGMYSTTLQMTEGLLLCTECRKEIAEEG